MFEELKSRWRETGAGVKAGLVGAVIGIVVLAALAALWALSEDYQILFSDLAPPDAAAIVSELDRMKVPYRLADDGATVLVAKDAVHATRLKVLSKGGVNLQGTVGFEIFNNTDFGMTDFAQKINYQRALQGELARTIMSFDEVKQARVHLVMPETGILKRSGVKPKASVTVTERAGRHLRAEQVTGIQRLVAAAVAELDPGSVTVLDQQGVVLSKTIAEDADSEAAGARLELKRQTEAYLTRKAAEILEKTFGPGQAIVSVDVTLDYDHTRITREQVVPLATRDGEPIGAVTRKRETILGPRTGGDLEMYPNTQTDGNETAPRIAPRTPRNVSVESEYQSGRRTEQVVSTPGGIRRISVGVIVPNGLEAAQVRRLTDVIAMSIGLDAGRGDAISVVGVDVKRAAAGGPPATGVEAGASGAAEDKEPSPVGDRGDRAARMAGLVSMLALLCGAVAAVLMLLLLWLRRRRARLDAGQREALLAELRNWVEQGGTG